MASRSSSDSVPVVLRVKRKRTEEPADALVIPTKLTKLDPLLHDQDQRVFHFAGTVQAHDHSTKEVLAQVTKHRRQLTSVKQLTSFSNLSISHQQESRREASKDSASTQRFKLVSRCRSLEEEGGTEQPSVSSTQGEEHEGSTKKPLLNELVHMYDLEQETPPLSSCVQNGGASSKEKPSDDDTLRGAECMNDDMISVMKNCSRSIITCNSTPMVQERVCGTSDYVYDLYYTQTSNVQEMMSYNWASVCAWSYEEPMLVHDEIDSDEDQYYDDEYDSNDEGNWRNDYPDEQEDSSCNLSDEEDALRYQPYSDYSGDEEKNGLDGSYWDQT